jgi:hypothetical protein
MKTFAGTGIIKSVFMNAAGHLFVSPEYASSNAAEGLWKCADPVGNPTTWTQVIDLSAYATGRIWAIDQDPSGNMYAGVYQTTAGVKAGIIYKSTDNGDNWSTVYSNTANAAHVHTIICAPNGDIYASLGDGISAWYFQKVLKSTNQGTDWTEILASQVRQPVGMVSTPTARIFGSDAGDFTIYRSTNDTSASISYILPTIDSTVFWLRRDPITGFLYAGSVQGAIAQATLAVYYSTDDGVTWHPFYAIAGGTAYDGFQSASNIVNGKIVVTTETAGSLTNAAILTLPITAPDLHLQGTSPAINAGTNVSLTTDYAGNNCPKGTYDIGAYCVARVGSINGGTIGQ